jgi:hypothetical protein
MSERKSRLKDIIQADHEASLAIFRSLSEAEWQAPVPSEEAAPWTARDVLAHLAVSEGGQLGQITRLVSGGITVPDDFDLARFNRRSVQKQADRSVPDLLAQIERDHEEVLRALDAVPEADLDKTGRHARGDTLTVEQFFHRITEHRREHAQELQRAIRGG